MSASAITPIRKAAGAADTPIIAALVLYRMRLCDSATYRSLEAAFRMQPALERHFALRVYDNSPEAGEQLQDFRGAYIHDGRNAGLAARYNDALAAAEDAGCTWLLLLDQDTDLTPTYLAELVDRATALAAEAQPAAVVPSLRLPNGALLSPHRPPFADGIKTAPARAGKILPADMWVFNSGALLRVRALRAAGGFPEPFWLDYLDHATFAALRATGAQTMLMNSTLTHELAQESTTQPISRRRMRSIAIARARFYASFGTPSERVAYRRELTRAALGQLRRLHLPSAWLLLRLRSGRLPADGPNAASRAEVANEPGVRQESER